MPSRVCLPALLLLIPASNRCSHLEHLSWSISSHGGLSSLLSPGTTVISQSEQWLLVAAHVPFLFLSLRDRMKSTPDTRAQATANVGTFYNTWGEGITH